MFVCLSDIYFYYIYIYIFFFFIFLFFLYINFVVSCIVLCMLYWVPLENEMKHLKGLSLNKFNSMFSASRNCVQILATWGRALSLGLGTETRYQWNRYVLEPNQNADFGATFRCHARAID